MQIGKEIVEDLKVHLRNPNQHLPLIVSPFKRNLIAKITHSMDKTLVAKKVTTKPIHVPEQKDGIGRFFINIGNFLGILTLFSFGFIASKCSRRGK